MKDKHEAVHELSLLLQPLLKTATIYTFQGMQMLCKFTLI